MLCHPKKRTGDSTMTFLSRFKIDSPMFTKYFQGTYRRFVPKLLIFLLEQLYNSKTMDFKGSNLSWFPFKELVVNGCGRSSFNNETPQMLPHYHHIVPTKSWTKTNNNVDNCENSSSKPSNAHLFLNLQSFH
jgi:hypothetical protein